MLLSHSKKFIFFKTKKTASTSVELFFEKFCSPKTKISEATEELISNFGIVGSRMFKQNSFDTYYNHMPAEKILSSIGPKIFDSYHKFSIVRNPYDKLVSMFWWHQFVTSQLNNVSRLNFKDIRIKFREFILKEENIPQDKNIYTINGEIVANRILKYENLLEDLNDCCKFLDIPFEPNTFRTYKRVKSRVEPFQDYYDEETVKYVKKFFDWELKMFSYDF